MKSQDHAASASIRVVKSCPLLALAHPRLQGPRRLLHSSRGVGADPPVAFQDVGVKDITQGRYPIGYFQGALEREVCPQSGVADRSATPS
jgi:hypothetical protein